MEHTVTEIDTRTILFSDGSHAMKLHIIWKEADPPFDLDTMRWEPPFDTEPLDFDHKLQILRCVLIWLRPKGVERLWLGSHGWFDGTQLLQPSKPVDLKQILLSRGWQSETGPNGVPRFRRPDRGGLES